MFLKSAFYLFFDLPFFVSHGLVVLFPAEILSLYQYITQRDGATCCTIYQMSLVRKGVCLVDMQHIHARISTLVLFGFRASCDQLPLSLLLVFLGILHALLLAAGFRLVIEGFQTISLLRVLYRQR